MAPVDNLFFNNLGISMDRCWLLDCDMYIGPNASSIYREYNLGWEKFTLFFKCKVGYWYCKLIQCSLCTCKLLSSFLLTCFCRYIMIISPLKWQQNDDFQTYRKADEYVFNACQIMALATHFIQKLVFSSANVISCYH